MQSLLQMLYYNTQRDEFLGFLRALQNGTIQTEQLFLMGDMFDFIAGGCHYFIKMNKKIINIINDLSETLEIIYLEGNHDYNLKNYFSKCTGYCQRKTTLDGNISKSKSGYFSWGYFCQ